MAERLERPADIATSEMHIAKLFGLITDKIETNQTDFTTARTMHDIGAKLLQSIGMAAPDDASIAKVRR